MMVSLISPHDLPLIFSFSSLSIQTLAASLAIFSASAESGNVSFQAVPKLPILKNQ